MGLVTSSPKPSFGTAHHHHDLPPRKVKGPFLLQGQGKAEIHSVFMDQTIAFLKSLSPSRYSIWYTGLSMLSGAGVAGESRLPGLQSSGVANALGLRGQGQAGDGASSRWSWLGRLDCRPTPPPPQGHHGLESYPVGSYFSLLPGVKSQAGQPTASATCRPQLLC